ncbi:hypothetical protein V9K92_02185 [Phyllobacterium sp. CCNWLW109]|uniref:hypothetical protein n=1 Tax=Phyllobacterium sp. CCNWLW109 TaxID=3127479 RepID=UPI003077F5A8
MKIEETRSLTDFTFSQMQLTLISNDAVFWGWRLFVSGVAGVSVGDRATAGDTTSWNFTPDVPATGPKTRRAVP